MIAIKGHLVSLDLGNHDDLLALIVGSLQLHPFLEFLAAFDLVGSDHGDLGWVGKSVSLVGRDRDRESITGLLALHDFFQALHDLSFAM